MDVSRQDHQTVKLNLRGNIFITETEKLRRFPNSRLGSISHSDANYNFEKDEYFFDRSPFLFHFILDLYRDGCLHLPRNACSNVIKEELKYWKISRDVLSNCCMGTYYKDDDDLQIYEELEEAFRRFNKDIDVKTSKPENVTDNGTSVTSWRQRLWYMLVDPMASKMSKIYFAVVLVAVFTSIMVYLMSTVEYFRVDRPTDLGLQFNTTNPKLLMYIRTRPHVSIFALDLISNTMLLIDYIVIVYASPNRLLMMTSWFYVADIFAIISVYSFNICDRINYSPVSDDVSLKVMTAFVGVVYSCRIFLILRIMGHTKGAVALFMTFASRISVISFFILGFVAVCLLSAVMVYHAELWAHNSFPDIFRAFWWAIITLSSVGYGDTVPETVAGRVITVFVIIVGLMLIAIPFVIITSNYGNYYSCYDNLIKHYGNRKNLLQTNEIQVDPQSANNTQHSV